MANIGKKIADGLYGKMEFEFACNRGHAFGEYFMHGVINEILAANTGKPLETICADTERDNFMSAEEAKEYGLVDKVIYNR